MIIVINHKPQTTILTYISWAINERELQSVNNPFRHYEDSNASQFVVNLHVYVHYPLMTHVPFSKSTFKFAME